MHIAYVRVSTVEQNEARQKENLRGYDIDKWFIDKASAKDVNRPQLAAMLEFVRDGDTVYIDDFSRLARNIVDLLKLIELFEKKQVNLVSHKEKIDSQTPMGKLMLTMIGAINEFERSILLERQREGIEEARKKGKYKGRKSINIPENTFQQEYSRYLNREITKKELAENLKISRPTLDKLLKKYKKQE